MAVNLPPRTHQGLGVEERYPHSALNSQPAQAPLPPPPKGATSPYLACVPLSCYTLPPLPPTPTQSLSQTVSCSFPSDQFLKRDNYPQREEAENAPSQEHQEKLHLVQSPPARTGFVLNTGQLWLLLPPNLCGSHDYRRVHTHVHCIRGLPHVSLSGLGLCRHHILSGSARPRAVCCQDPHCIVRPPCVTSAGLVFQLFTCLSPT